MTFKIFISYSTSDLEHVESLRQQLIGTPIEVFIAEYSVAPSEILPKKISNAIRECDFFVLIWSENAKNSDWVSQEIGQALAMNKSILPLVFSKGIGLPGFIKNLKYLSVYKDPKSALDSAREQLLIAYNQKQQMIQKSNQKDMDTMMLLGAGAFLFWAFTKK